MLQIYPLFTRLSVVVAMLTLVPPMLTAQDCDPPPAEIIYSSDGGQNQDALLAAFKPAAADQPDFDGDEYAFAVSASGIQAGPPVCVTEATNGEYFFNQITIFRTFDCFEEIFPGFTFQDVNPNCNSGRSLTSLQLTDQTGNQNYEGYFFVVFDPDNGGEYFLVTGDNGEPFASDRSNGFFPESTSNPPTPPDSPPNDSRDVPEESASSFDDVQAALPVEFTTFTGHSNGKHVVLNWATQSEDGNATFKVQRSLVSGEFTTIGEVAGAGTSRTELNYTFTDRTAPAATNYYRLKQLDFSGEFTYSSIISVDTGSETENSVLLFPNPTSGEFNLVASGEWKQPLVSLIDANGRIVREWNGLDVGISTPLSLRGLPRAIYQVRIADGDKVITQRVTKQ